MTQIKSFPILEPGENPSYRDFFQSHISLNVPCLLKGDRIAAWRCRRDWVNGADGSVNMDFLEKLVPGDLQVPVSRCSKRRFNSQVKYDV